MNTWLQRAGLGLATGASVLAMPGTAAATTSGSETIIVQRAATRGAGDVWSASGLFSDSGGWRRAVSYYGSGPSTYNAERFTTEDGADGSFRVDMQVHVNTATDNGVHGTWVIDAGTSPDAPSGAYVSLRGQGSFTSTLNSQTGTRTYTLVGDVHLQ